MPQRSCLRLAGAKFASVKQTVQIQMARQVRYLLHVLKAAMQIHWRRQVCYRSLWYSALSPHQLGSDRSSQGPEQWFAQFWRGQS